MPKRSPRRRWTTHCIFPLAIYDDHSGTTNCAGHIAGVFFVCIYPTYIVGKEKLKISCLSVKIYVYICIKLEMVPATIPVEDIMLKVKFVTSSDGHTKTFFRDFDSEWRVSRFIRRFNGMTSWEVYGCYIIEGSCGGRFY